MIRHIPVLINEQSCPTTLPNGGELRAVVLQFLQTLRRTREIAPDVTFGCVAPLHNLVLSAESDTLASVAGGIGKDWWRFVASISQRAPLQNLDGATDPSPLHCVCAGGIVSEGVSWAFANDTVAISFWRAGAFEGSGLSVDRCDCLCLTHPQPAPGIVRHASESKDVDAHANHLREYALPLDGGSLVYRNESFELRMPPRDHEPMHVHVCPPGDSSIHWATVRFDVGPEVLSGALPGSLWPHVKRVVSRGKGDLSENWRRRREGRPAFLIADG